ncbi:MAG: 1-deoxy-D-xylulose-5-phosphate reductoisomerase [Candidatus Shapirobacteria bacterium]|nr:1-deoxy-D-xylulose-5-phosphate reductoisomerase [Candidatus Shapirobacteria bacterium]
MTKKKIIILGSTGSVGRQTLDVIGQNKDKFEVVGLVCKDSIDLVEKQANNFGVKNVGVANKDKYKKKNKSWVWGEEEIEEMIRESQADIVVAAISGAKSLRPTLAAIESGKDVALSSKEVIVLAGKIIMQKVEDYGVNLLPIDSEHSAIWQALRSGEKKEVEKIILTCSGGPFLKWKKKDFDKITPQAALNHPNWSMGPRITIDSATWMNKGLEFIEAKYLFDLKDNEIEVVVHPQSLIHSAVQFWDGSVIAQVGCKDMRLPIQYALSYPQRWPNIVERVNWFNTKMEFEKPDLKRFPALRLAMEAAKIDGSMPIVLNAADEIAVDLFLNRKIKFTEIPKLIEKTMKKHKVIKDPNLEEILEVDLWSREKAKELSGVR